MDTSLTSDQITYLCILCQKHKCECEIIKNKILNAVNFILPLSANCHKYYISSCINSECKAFINFINAIKQIKPSDISICQFIENLKNFIILWHGTPDQNNAFKICCESWDLSQRGTNGQIHGQGEYFSNIKDEAPTTYAKKNGVIIVSLVLSPDICDKIKIVIPSENEKWYVVDNTYNYSYAFPIGIIDINNNIRQYNELHCPRRNPSLNSAGTSTTCNDNEPSYYNLNDVLCTTTNTNTISITSDDNNNEECCDTLCNVCENCCDKCYDKCCGKNCDKYCNKCCNIVLIFMTIIISLIPIFLIICPFVSIGYAIKYGNNCDPNNDINIQNTFINNSNRMFVNKIGINNIIYITNAILFIILIIEYLFEYKFQIYYNICNKIKLNFKNKMILLISGIISYLAIGVYCMFIHLLFYSCIQLEPSYNYVITIILISSLLTSIILSILFLFKFLFICT